MNPAPNAILSRETLGKLKKLLTLRQRLAEMTFDSDLLEVELISELFPSRDAGKIVDESTGAEVELQLPKGPPVVTDESLNEVMPLMPAEFRQLGRLIEYAPRVIGATYSTLDDDTRAIFDKACQFNTREVLVVRLPYSPEKKPSQSVTIKVNVDTKRARGKLARLRKDAKATKTALAKVKKSPVKKTAKKKTRR